MADTSERIVILSALLLAIIIVITQGMYLSDGFSPSERKAIRIGREFLDGGGYKTGKVLSIEIEEREPNFYWDYTVKYDRPDITGLRTCWVIQFEQRQRPGHYFEVWIDASEHIIVGGTQCR